MVLAQRLAVSHRTPAPWLMTVVPVPQNPDDPEVVRVRRKVGGGEVVSTVLTRVHRPGDDVGQFMENR